MTYEPPIYALGSEVIDTVTGFRGFATARVEYLSGCVQYCIVPKVGVDGKMPDGVYLDEQRLKLAKAPKREPRPRFVRSGGPQRDEPGTGQYRAEPGE